MNQSIARSLPCRPYSWALFVEPSALSKHGQVGGNRENVEQQFTHAIPHDLHAEAQQDECGKARKHGSSGIANQAQKVFAITKCQILQDADAGQCQQGPAHARQRNDQRYIVQRHAYRDCNGNGGRPATDWKGEWIECLAVRLIGRERLRQRIAAVWGGRGRAGQAPGDDRAALQFFGPMRSI